MGAVSEFKKFQVPVYAFTSHGHVTRLCFVIIHDALHALQLQLVSQYLLTQGPRNKVEEGTAKSFPLHQIPVMVH